MSVDSAAREVARIWNSDDMTLIYDSGSNELGAQMVDALDNLVIEISNETSSKIQYLKRLLKDARREVFDGSALAKRIDDELTNSDESSLPPSAPA